NRAYFLVTHVDSRRFPAGSRRKVIFCQQADDSLFECRHHGADIQLLAAEVYQCIGNELSGTMPADLPPPTRLHDWERARIQQVLVPSILPLSKDWLMFQQPHFI